MFCILCMPICLSPTYNPSVRLGKSKKAKTTIRICNMIKRKAIGGQLRNAAYTRSKIAISVVKAKITRLSFYSSWLQYNLFFSEKEVCSVLTGPVHLRGPTRTRGTHVQRKAFRISLAKCAGTLLSS
jgi:hypothetical protein